MCDVLDRVESEGRAEGSNVCCVSKSVVVLF